MTHLGKQRAVQAVDAALARRGYTGADLVVAREPVRDWLRARRSTGGRRGTLAGVGVLVPRPGRAELVGVEVPLAGPGEVTVELLVSAISPGTERAQWLRLPNAQPAMPYRPGYSGAGRVVAVGSDVSALAVGDLVAVPRAPHASVATVPASWPVRVPDGVPPEQAALVYLAIISGYGVRRGAVGAGQAVCVLGSGPIGALAARLAGLAGADPLTVVARSDRHAATAALAGADFRSLADGVADLAADVVLEATGDPSAVATAVATTRDGGTVVLLGSPRGTSAVPMAEVQRRRLRLVGAHISALATEARSRGTDPFREMATTFLDGLGRGRLTTADLAGEAVDPREIGLLYRRLASGELAAAHLDWSLLPAGERASRRGVVRLPRLPPLTRTVLPRGLPPVRHDARTVRFAVIGCGDIGLQNARAVSRAPNAELVLLHDAVPALAQAAAHELGGAVVGSIAEALDPGRVDAVLVSVPHDLHTPLVAQAAAAGLHVVVEKPLAVDLDAAREAVDAADRAGVHLSVCFPFRYETAVTAARALVSAGALGPLAGVGVVFHADKPPSYWRGGFSGRASSDWRAVRARSGGGVMIMNLTHQLDALRYVTGEEISHVSAVARQAPGQDVEETVAVHLRLAGGAIGSLLGSAGTRGAPASRFDVWGEHGSLQLEPEGRLYTERSLPGLLTGRWNTLPVDPVDERAVFVERFCGAVLDGRAPEIDGRDGLAVQAVVEAVYRSLDTGLPEVVAPTVSA